MLNRRVGHLSEEIPNGCEHGLSNSVCRVFQHARAKRREHDGLELLGTGKGEARLYAHPQPFQQLVFQPGLSFLVNRDTQESQTMHEPAFSHHVLFNR